MTTELADPTRMLGDLLAIIHRDGGHRQDEVGTEQAWMEAMMTVPFLLEAKDAALTPGVGYAAGIEDAAKRLEDSASMFIDQNCMAVQVLKAEAVCVRRLKPASLPQPAPAEDALRNAWQPIETAPRDGTPLHLFDPEYCDEEMNPSLSGHWSDGANDEEGGFYAAVWNNCQDYFATVIVAPTHWMPPTAPPRQALTGTKGDGG